MEFNWDNATLRAFSNNHFRFRKPLSPESAVFALDIRASRPSRPQYWKGASLGNGCSVDQIEREETFARSNSLRNSKVKFQHCFRSTRPLAFSSGSKHKPQLNPQSDFTLQANVSEISGRLSIATPQHAAALERTRTHTECSSGTC